VTENSMYGRQTADEKIFSEHLKFDILAEDVNI